ncbi:MAG: hypothetical protein PWP04_1467 [Candidatus Atribacteria bacterium]|nr:hypothetical protein [Candidatus Atribacteria bacterium]
MSDYQLVSLQQRLIDFSIWLGFGIGVAFMVWLAVRRPMLGVMLIIGIIAFLLGIMLFFGLDGVLSLRRAVPALLVVAILFPPIRLPGGIPDVRPEFIIAVIAWGLLLLSHLATGLPIRLRKYPSYKWFGLFGLSILVSMAYAGIIKNQLIIGRDFQELIKLLLYFLIFTLIANQDIKPTSFKHYYKLALVVLMLSAFFGFMQYIDFAGINQVLSPYYAPTQMRGLLVHGRITGTTPNPNEFGALMVLAISLAISGVLFFQERKTRLLCWVALPVFGLALFLTMSRTSLVATFLAVGLILILFLRQRGIKYKWRRIVALVVFIFIVGCFILQVAPEKALFRYSQLANFTEATSWVGRVENWNTHFALWMESPLFGWGPGKSTMGTIVDNEWLLLMRRYGVIGLVVFLGLFGSLFIGLCRIRSVNTEVSIVALTVALQGTFAGYALYMMLASIYHSLQLMPIFLLFLGLAYSQYKPRIRTQEVSKL